MMDFSYNELMLIERVGKIMGMSNEEVVRTPYTKLIAIMAVKYSEVKLENAILKEVIQGIKDSIEDL